MDAEQIKQLANDVNNVALASFQSGKEHIERPLMTKIDQLQARIAELKEENKTLWEAIEFTTVEYDKAMSFEEDSLKARIDLAIDGLCKLVEKKQTLKEK